MEVSPDSHLEKIWNEIIRGHAKECKVNKNPPKDRKSIEMILKKTSHPSKMENSCYNQTLKKKAS